MGIIIRQSIKGSIVTYIGAFIGFLTTMFIATEFLGKEGLGLISVFAEAGLLFATIFQLGTSASAIRFFSFFKSKDGKNNGFFYYLVMIPLVGFCLFLPIFLLFKEPISHYFEKNSPLFVDYYNWLLPFTFFLIYWTVFETYSNVMMRIAVPKIFREIVLRLLTIAVFLLYALHYISLDGLIAGYVLIHGICMCCTFFYVAKIGSVSLKHDPLFITRPIRKDFLSYTSFLLIGSIGSSLIPKIDIFMVSSGIGLASTGIYTIAFRLISIIEIPSRSISTISSPLASEYLRAGNIAQANELYKKVSLHQLVIGSLIFLLIWINIDNIYRIIPDGESYSEGKWVVLFIGITKIIEATINFGNTLINFSRYYRWSVYFVFFITGLTIFLNYLLIPIYGITGAALGTAIASLISYSAQQWLVFIKIKGNPYSKGTLKQILMLLALLALNYCLPAFGNPWLDGIFRTSVIGIAGLALYSFIHISNEINSMLDQAFQQVKRLLHFGKK